MSILYRPQTFRGREEGFGGDRDRYVATLRVMLEHRDGGHSLDRDDLRCVAERAASAASLAYNLHNTRIIEVTLESIEESSGE